MMKPSPSAAWLCILAGAFFLPVMGNGCSSSLKASGTGSGGAAGGAGGGGTGGLDSRVGGRGVGGLATGGADSGGSGGKSTGGAGGINTVGSGGNGVGGSAVLDGGGGSGGSTARDGAAGHDGNDGNDGNDSSRAALDGGVGCSSDTAGGPSFTFCAGADVYRVLPVCNDGGTCVCIASVFSHCDFGCVSSESFGAACALPDASPPDTATIPDASKLDGLTMAPPDGANLSPPCPPGKFSGFREKFCYGSGLYWSGIACPAGGACNCMSSLSAYCVNHCVELAGESAECQ